MSSDEKKIYKKLEAFVEELSAKNHDQHNNILERLEKCSDRVENTTINLHWISIISKTILVTIFAYFFGAGYILFDSHFVKEEECNKIEKWIQHGDVLHYNNEARLKAIETYIQLEKERQKLGIRNQPKQLMKVGDKK